MLAMRRVVVAGFLFLTAALPAVADPPAKRQIGQMVLDGIPEWDPAMRERMLQYLENRRTGLRSVSDDGSSILITTRFGGANQIHLLTMPMGMRRQITFFDEPVGSASFIPNAGGREILFGRDVGGNEKTQYYRLDLKTGTAALQTDGTSRHAGATLSRNGRYLAFSGTARNEKDFDVYLIDNNAPPDARKPKMIWQVEGSYYVGGFSPDESRLIVQHYLSERDTQWHMVDIASGQHALVTPESPPAFYGGGDWSHDGKAVFFTSDRDGEFRKIYRLDLEFGKWQCLTSDINWDVDEVAVDPAGKGIAFVANEDGYSKLYFADEWGNNRKPVADLPPGVIGGLTFARNGGVLGFTLQSSRSPSDAYTTTFPEGRVTRWTESEIGGLNPEQFVEPTLIRYPTFDSIDGKPRQISALYYKGRGDWPRPVVIYCHGGPEGQTQPTFSSIFQYWVTELGISVICPNIRGSTGYGRSFHQLDNGVKRMDSVRDVGALLDWIAKQPEMDAKRVGIYGGSYGGYMVLASLVTYPERFKAGIDVVGIASLVSFLETTPEYRRDLRRAEYGDERDPAVRAELEKASALPQAETIKAALLVAHGKNDPRVPVTEAEQIVAKVRGLGRPVWFALALDEGHGFQKKANTDLIAVIYSLFWQKQLLE
ncbi:MAG: alpha/beta fold hydrolase [Phycisphaerae bacterium]